MNDFSNYMASAWVFQTTDVKHQGYFTSYGEFYAAKSNSLRK